MEIRSFARKMRWLLNRMKVPSEAFSHLSTVPISAGFGFNRGTPIDRFYIEQFLDKKRSSIMGTVVEVGESSYTKRFAGVECSSIVLGPSEGPGINLVCDLSQPLNKKNQGIADTFICLQTLNFIYDYQAALRNIKLLMRPGGTVLITVAGVSQISQYDADRWGDYFRFTKQSLGRMINEIFDGDLIEIESYGNVRTATSLFYGLVAEDIESRDLMVNDPVYPVIVTAFVKMHNAL